MAIAALTPAIAATVKPTGPVTAIHIPLAVSPVVASFAVITGKIPDKPLKKLPAVENSCKAL